MAITISRADYDELWKVRNPAPLVTSHSGYCERVEIVPEQFGEGCIRSIQLRGIELLLLSYQLREDLQEQYECEESEPYWELVRESQWYARWRKLYRVGNK